MTSTRTITTAELLPGDLVTIDRATAGLAAGGYGPTMVAYFVRHGARGALYVEEAHRTPTHAPWSGSIPAAAFGPLDLETIELARRYPTVEAAALAAALELEEELDEELEARPLIIVPCGAAKLDHAAPAGELYTGALHRSARQAADRLALELDAEVVILSALHGILDLDTVVDPYNVTIGDDGTIALADLAGQLAARNTAGRRIIVLGGARYVELVEAAADDVVEAPLAGCAGLGYMRGRCAAIARTGRLRPHADELGPAGRQAEQLALTI